MFGTSKWLSICHWVEQAAPAPHYEAMQPASDTLEEDTYPLETYLKQIGALHHQFPRLFTAFQQSACAADLALPPADLVLALALAAFGPEAVGEPPAQLWHDLKHIAATRLPANAVDDPQYCRDLVIAYGCGWSRSVVLKKTDDWDARWQNAVLALCNLTSLSVAKALKQLSELVDTSDLTANTFDLGNSDDIMSYADEIFAQLTSPLCFTKDYLEAELRKLVATAANEQTNEQQELLEYYLKHYAILCGDREVEPAADIVADAAALKHKLPRYHPRHRLVRWNPRECRLWHFIADAVYGPSFKHQEKQQDTTRDGVPRRLQGGAFASSMLYPIVERERQVIVGQVEFKRCHYCCDKEYQKDTCDACKRPADRSQTYYFPRKNWIIIPRQYGGLYELVQRWPCSECENLYPFTATPADLRQEQKALRKRERALRNLITILGNAEQHTTLLRQVAAHPAISRQALADIRYYLHDPQPLIAVAQEYLVRCQRELPQRANDLAEPPTCPLHSCGGKPRQRPVSVWIYSPGRRAVEEKLEAPPDVTESGTLPRILSLLLVALLDNDNDSDPDLIDTG